MFSDSLLSTTPDIRSDSLYSTTSDILSGISFDVLSGVLSGRSSDSLSASGISSVILSDILCMSPPIRSDIGTHLLTFCLASLLAIFSDSLSRHSV